MDYIKAIGPAIVISAVVVGPGSVTTASSMGASYNYALLWVVVMAALASFFYQLPAIRVALAKEVTIMEAVRMRFGKMWALVLYYCIAFGSLIFQAGNFTGAAMAMEYFVPQIPLVGWAAIMILVAFVLAWTSHYSVLETFTKGLVIMMVIAFVATAIGSKPHMGDMITQGFSFQIPEGDFFLVLAMLATTMVPDIPVSLSAHPEQADLPVRLPNLAPAAPAQRDDGPVGHAQALAVQAPDMAQVDQEAPLAAEKEPPGQPPLQGGQGLPGGDGPLRAVDKAVPPGALHPDQIAEREPDPAAVAGDLQPLQGVPPELDAAVQGGPELIHPDGLPQKAGGMERIAGDGRPAAGGAEKQRALPDGGGRRGAVVQIPEEDPAGLRAGLRGPVRKFHRSAGEPPPGLQHAEKGCALRGISHMYGKLHGTHPPPYGRRHGPGQPRNVVLARLYLLLL